MPYFLTQGCTEGEIESWLRSLALLLLQRNHENRVLISWQLHTFFLLDSLKTVFLFPPSQLTPYLNSVCSCDILLPNKEFSSFLVWFYLKLGSFLRLTTNSCSISLALQVEFSSHPTPSLPDPYKQKTSMSARNLDQFFSVFCVN